MIEAASTEQAIMARLKTILPRVYDTEVPEGQDPGDPYIVVFFGDPIRIAADHHITGTVNDTLRGYLTVQVVATTPEAARSVRDRAKKSLIGYRPPDSGEIIAEGGLSYSRASTSSSPTKFIREMGFSYMTNLGWNE